MDKQDSIITNMPDIRVKIRIIILLGIVNVFLMASYFLLTHFTVRTVQVDGNKHYSAEEIKAMVMTGYLGDNSLYLSLKYKNKGIEGVPFVETMDVMVQSNDTIRITVYEKALAGYVQYLGRYMYFDNEGVVVETSKVTTKGIPQVTGLSFDHVVLHEKLPVENEQIFQNILTITKLLNKYDVLCDRIQFDKNYNVTLGYGGVKVNIGALDNLDEKLMQLPQILPSLAGERGTLDLQNYTADRKSVSFEKGK
ncbi:MAG: FtsQ-type POTRA domain-containing protein [Lachnospiraceae bacterium]|jgi:cell division protein FtsQ|nr:FtsQ-type POTRA domain-containing protein [Lachnospiraceae bacterium]